MRKISKSLLKNLFSTDISRLASNLTYVSLLAIFPFIALILGLSKGFSLDVILVDKIKNTIPETENILSHILKIAENLVKSLNSSLLSGLGIIVIMWSVVNLLILLEESFNDIWHVKNSREFSRKVINYIAIIFLIPIVTVIFIGTSDKILELTSKIATFGSFTIFLVKFLKFILIFSLFTTMYYIIPNTKVSFKASSISSLMVILFLYIFSMFYTIIQVSISKYNAIYGSLAFVPLFLIWVKFLWLVILIGAKLSYMIDNNYDSNDKKLPLKYEKEISIYILYLIIKRFIANEIPYTISELTQVTGIKKYAIRIGINTLCNLSYITKVYTKDDEIMYQVNKNPDYIKLNKYIYDFEMADNDNFDIFENEDSKRKYEELLSVIEVQKDKLILDMEDNKWHTLLFF